MGLASRQRAGLALMLRPEADPFIVDRSVPGTPGTPRQFVSSDIGYHDIVFSGKKAQASRVESKIKELGFIPESLVKGEVEW